MAVAKEFAAAHVTELPPPPLAIVDLDFSSNHLSEKHVTQFKIYIELKALEGCFDRICSCRLVMKPPPLLS